MMKYLRLFEDLSCYSFPPIVNRNSKILILGTMPGRVSLSKNEYYANRGNIFWKLISDIFDVELLNYEDKKKSLLDNGIAIWDVLKYCDREGSMDINIKNIVVNNFEEFFKRYDIEKVLFNGQKAKNIYERKVGLNDKYFNTLPSTSGANTHLSYDEKLKLWKSEIS